MNHHAFRLAWASLLIFSAILSTSGQRVERKITQELDQLIRESPVFRQHLTGVLIQDLVTGQTIYAKDSGMLFTPASNTKLVSFLVAREILNDTFHVWRLAETTDRIILQGTGNPLWQHPDFKNVVHPQPWLNRGKPLALSFENMLSGRFGPGWSWSDYPYAYQVERSAIPVAGNLIRFERDSFGRWTSFPGNWLTAIRPDAGLENLQPRIRRDEGQNLFSANAAALRMPFQLAIPLRTDEESIRKLFCDELQQPVVASENLPPEIRFEPVKMAIPDTMYRYFLQESDNFIGEQLLLLCSDKKWGTLDADRLIRYALDSLLVDLPRRPVWVDGSGLSRYNLFSPSDMVVVLRRLAALMPLEYLTGLLPAGGVSGTLSRDYLGVGGKPYVFAKTGTLANNHCLSGFLHTAKGNTLVFSFMNNHFAGSSAPIKKAMEKVFVFLRDNR